MKWSVLRAALVGAAVLASAIPARAGFISVALTAGGDGSSTPSASGGFQFTNQSGSSQVSVAQFGDPAGAVQAGAGGGFSIFNMPALGVVLNLSDGAAYLASANAPATAVPAAGLASGLPDVGGLIPLDASLLALIFSDPTADGGRDLSVYSTDYTGEVTGIPGAAFVAAEVTVPGGGWWVMGLTPGEVAPPPPIDYDPTSPPVWPPVPVTPSDPPAATPEPATLVIAGLGLPLVGAARLLRRGRRLARA